MNISIFAQFQQAGKPKTFIFILKKVAFVQQTKKQLQNYRFLVLTENFGTRKATILQHFINMLVGRRSRQILLKLENCQSRMRRLQRES
jgi:hypothetical protein